MKNLLKIPNHIAIIMDGNGRWGIKHKNSRTLGHKQGVLNLEKIINYCIDIGVKSLSVYAFSTENWSRPTFEVKTLMSLFDKYLSNEIDSLNEKGIRLFISGSKKGLSKQLLNSIDNATKALKDNNKFNLNICFNYGGRNEIIDAINRIINDKKENITEEEFKKYLYFNLEYPDLLIRSGGDLRISNFLLWQIAYSELYFTDCLWPDFDEKEMEKAIIDFSKRDRRFGGLNETR